MYTKEYKAKEKGVRFMDTRHHRTFEFETTDGRIYYQEYPLDTPIRLVADDALNVVDAAERGEVPYWMAREVVA